MDADVPSPEVFSTDRLEAFSDGVLAVIITIMAFELKAPAGAGIHDLAKEVPGLLAYILSFTGIGIYWNNHHHLLRATPRISASVMWSNLLLLFWLSLLPVATQWVASKHQYALPASIYGCVAFGAAISYTILVRAIFHSNPADAFVVQAIGSDRKGFASLALYAAGIGLAFVSWVVAYALYATVALIWLIPDRRLSRNPASTER